MAFTMLITYFGSSLTGIVGVFTNYFKSKISYNRIIEFLNFEDANIYGGEENLDNKYSIKIRNVSFAYDEISVFSNFAELMKKHEHGVLETTTDKILIDFVTKKSTRTDTEALKKNYPAVYKDVVSSSESRKLKFSVQTKTI